MQVLLVYLSGLARVLLINGRMEDMEMKTRSMMGLVIALPVLAVLLAGCGTCCKTGGCPTGKCAMSGSCKSTVAVQKAQPVIGTEALATLLRAKTPAAVLDARSGKFDDGQRIPGARSLNAGSTEAEIAQVLPDKGALVVTYCAGLKCPASHQLAEKLVKLGYSNVVEYPEGIAGWLEAGNKVDKVEAVK